MTFGDYQFWLLDLDGTLVDVDQDYPRSVLTQVGDQLGYTFTDEQIDTLWYGFDRSRDNCLQTLEIDHDLFWETYHAIEDPRTRAEATFLYDDAAVIGNMDIPVGLVTHCQQYLTEAVLEHLSIHDWFDVIVCCTEETGWKPDPTPVNAAMAELGVRDRPESGILAGDTPNDIHAAWNAGLAGVHVDRDQRSREEHDALGDHRIQRLTELVE